MRHNGEEFHIRPGSIRNGGGASSKSFVNQVLRAAQKAGHTTPRAGNGKRTGIGRSTFGRGRLAFSRNRLFSTSRRVVVKARIARHHGQRFHSAPLAAHLSYLKRDGVSRDGGKGVMFGAESDRADDAAFAERGKDDRHHFRFIVSPEYAAEMTDLKAFTRDLAAQMEIDLGTKLDWVAIDHWNTDNPHVHLLVRGVDQEGHDLVISRDYISHGLQARSEELVAIELGPKPEHEIRSALEREVAAERWTRLDAEIRFAADETGSIDLRPDGFGAGDSEIRSLMIGRLKHLETMGLANVVSPGQWVVGLETERALRDLGMRGDIIKTMHRAFTDQGHGRGIGDYVIGAEDAGSSVIGRLVEKGLHDEQTGEAYAIVDGTDGRAHYVRFRGTEAFEHAPPLGGIVEVRRLDNADDRQPLLILATRSDIDVARQVTAPGATWLDHRLVEREPVPLSMGGFGGEVRQAMAARAEHLAREGLARQQGEQIVPQRNLLETLRRREISAVGREIEGKTGLPFGQTVPGEQVVGIYRQRLTLSSGRFAVIDDGMGFHLVPWSPSLEKRIGQNVAGVIKDSGGIEWSFGRKRGLGL